MSKRYKRLIVLLIFLVAAIATCAQEKMCYTQPELRKIAIGLIERKEFKTLLFIAKQQLVVKDSIISAKDKQLVLIQKVSEQKEAIISEKNLAIDALEKQNKRLNRRIKWLKFGFAGSAAALGTIVLIQAL